MQHHSGEKTGAAQAISPDSSRSNPVQKNLGMGFGGNNMSTGYSGSDSIAIVRNSMSPSRFEEASSTGDSFPPRTSLSVELGYSWDLEPISPSAPFSRMRLNSKPSPTIPSLSLEAVDEREEYFTMEETDDMVMSFGNRGSMGNIFDIDDLTPRKGDYTTQTDTPELLPGFDQDCLQMEEVFEETKHSPSPSPGPDFHLKRRYTDGGKMGKIAWGPGYPPDFASYDIFPGMPSVSTEYLQVSSSCPARSGASSPAGPQSSYAKSETSDCSLHRTSSKRQRWQPPRPSTRCNQCISPDRPIEGQKVFLNQLPTELLLLIFEFAYSSPTKPSKCEHKQKSNIPYGSTIARRATTGSVSSLSDEPLRLAEGIRIYGAKTLLYIALTCRSFNNILLDPFVDNTFWRSAAQWCWHWLPKDLADVQGREETHQTSWRNLVGVFMRSENGLFKQKGGGRGGVECFGGNKECTPAILWSDENAKEILESKSVKGRKLLMVCAQPGPDLFNLSYDKESGKYTVSLGLSGGTDYFITINEYGRFGKKPARIPTKLKRSERSVGYFPPDIFEVEGDRFRLVKAWKGRDRPTTVHPQTGPGVKSPPKPAVKEIVTWDLHCVEEFEADPNATVARCTSKDGWLVFNLFTDRDDSSPELSFDPPEDQRLFCVQAFGCPGSQKVNTNDGVGGEKMSEKRRGKMKATGTTFMDMNHDTSEPTTLFRWRREFEYERASDFEAARHLHYVICNMKLNSTKAVVLVRWNVRTPLSNEELVDRQFQILDLKTGNTIRVLQFPNLYWDHRHHDMSIGYNEMRHKKMSRLYNHMGPDRLMGAGNRCTRIHEDNFVLTEDKIVSGSHDYCNWVWDLNAEPVTNENCVFNAERNDAGVADPFKVLDDFYWDEDQDQKVTAASTSWNTRSERAGWWVRTPNQVMCFWHGIAGSADGRYFAACRPGKMFVWDLEAERNTVMGFKNCQSSSSDSSNTRWMGKLTARADRLRHRLQNWFVWEDILPEQGLWLLFDDFEAVYLDRDDILNACGLSGKRTWSFQPDDFMFDDSDEGGNRGQKQREDSASASEADDNEFYESDEESGAHGPKRRRTNSFADEEFLGGPEPFRFRNEDEMDEYGQ